MAATKEADPFDNFIKVCVYIISVCLRVCVDVYICLYTHVCIPLWYYDNCYCYHLYLQ